MERAGKVALGAGSGIGKTSALRPSREGARAGALSHAEDKVHGAAEAIRETGGVG